MVKIAIDELPFDVDIEGHEGVATSTLAGIRVNVLLDQNKTMSTQTKFADAKAGALLAFIGLMATRGPAAVNDFSPLSLILLALHSVVLVACLIVLYPR